MVLDLMKTVMCLIELFVKVSIVILFIQHLHHLIYEIQKQSPIADQKFVRRIMRRKLQF